MCIRDRYELDDFGEEYRLALKNLILPSIVLGIRPIAVISMMMRNSMVEVLKKNYVITAYAKGLSTFQVVYRHCIKNSFNPVVTALSGWFASLLAGSVFVEYIFGWNGLGREIVNALNNLDIPVVIGAMLISPLMGPILGFGLAIAINDIDTLKKSTLNFFVMVFLSVFTAFLFFSFFPLKEESSELLSRTQPDIRDVLIAFFGGLALIIARTKKGTISSVVFGVAIATALMPPLCTVGLD